MPILEALLWLIIIPLFHATLIILALAFFFSSRRRHTRSDRDWSSDVCSSDLVLQRGGDARLQCRALGLLDEMRQGLRVGVGHEAVTATLERGPQGVRILDDTVVHQGDGAGAVGVRVCVPLGRRAVRRPARVRDAARSLHGLLRERVPQPLHASRDLAHYHTAAVLDRQARRVVPAVLEPPEALEQNRGRITRADVAHDAAHPQSSFVLGGDTLGRTNPHSMPRNILKFEASALQRRAGPAAAWRRTAFAMPPRRLATPDKTGRAANRGTTATACVVARLRFERPSPSGQRSNRRAGNGLPNRAGGARLLHAVREARAPCDDVHTPPVAGGHEVPTA